jgi:hypothetical protein
MSNNCLISLHRSVSRSCIQHLQIVVGLRKETILQTITASWCCYMDIWVMVPVVKNLCSARIVSQAHKFARRRDSISSKD